jgi:hypothetical protein
VNEGKFIAGNGSCCGCCCGGGGGAADDAAEIADGIAGTDEATLDPLKGCRDT